MRNRKTGAAPLSPAGSSPTPACKVGGGRIWRGLAYGAAISAFGLGIVALRLLTH